MSTPERRATTGPKKTLFLGGAVSILATARGARGDEAICVVGARALARHDCIAGVRCWSSRLHRCHSPGRGRIARRSVRGHQVRPVAVPGASPEGVAERADASDRGRAAALQTDGTAPGIGVRGEGVVPGNESRGREGADRRPGCTNFKIREQRRGPEAAAQLGEDGRVCARARRGGPS